MSLWNAIRGLDLLESRPEVDPEKMGVNGISGGGSQSWYIAAADPRIKAAAPVCGASTLKSQIGKRAMDLHCDCMMPVNTYQADFQDIGALIAPRPRQGCGKPPDGEGEAIEMLNCLRVTDVYQLPALVAPMRTKYVGEVPSSYKWSDRQLKRLSQ